MAAALSTLLGVCLAASVNPSAAGASSSPSASGLSAQAQQLESQVVQNAASLHAMADAAAADRQRLENTDAQIASDESSLQNLQTKLTQATATLRSIALRQYMQDTSDADLGVFWGTPERMATTATYEQLATTAQSNAVAAYLQDQKAVQRQQSILDSERSVAEDEYSSAQSQYSALRSAAQNMQGELDKVRQEEADLVRQQELAAARQAMLASQGPPAAVPLSVLAGSSGSQSASLGRLRACESGGNYGADTGNGYYGAYQFSQSTWQNLGYPGLPNQASPAQQDQAALSLAQSHGWNQWPECSAMLGLGG